MRELPSVCMGNNIMFIDFSPVMDNHPDWFIDHVHIKKEANFVLAELIAQKLLSIMKKESSFKSTF
ncbi:MAG: hypothetical protein AB1765_09595 [Candidatus Hydrogenedentota bacterium]